MSLRTASLQKFKWFTILLPPILIGSFEYIRHSEWLLNYLSMEQGNVFITLLSLIVSYMVSSWMFARIDAANEHLSEERTRRAVLEERERLARDLHDHIAQMLFYLNVSLKQGKLSEARSVAIEIDGHLRQAIFNLRTPPEHDISFAERMAKWVKEWSMLTKVDVERRIQISDSSLSPGEEILLFGIIQEAFTNIRKHSEATRVAFDLHIEPGIWTMRIADNGKGADLETISEDQYGISIMKKRADELRADLHICNGTSGGLEINLTKNSPKGAEP